MKAFGYSDVTGITFALLRRFRELIWIGIGLACLAVVGGDSILRKKTPQAKCLIRLHDLAKRVAVTDQPGGDVSWTTPILRVFPC